MLFIAHRNTFFTKTTTVEYIRVKCLVCTALEVKNIFDYMYTCITESG